MSDKYYLLGLDAYLAKRKLGQLLSKYRLIDNLDELNALSLNLDQNLLFGEVLPIVIYNLASSITQELWSMLLKTNRKVVIWETQPIKNVDLPTEFRNNFKQITVSKPTTSDVYRELDSQLMERQLKIHPSIKQYLLTRYANDLFGLANEVQTLSHYFGAVESEKVHLDQTYLRLKGTLVDSIFSTLDALGERNSARLLALCYEFMQINDPWFLYYQILTHLRSLMKAKSNIFSAVPDFVKNKLIKQGRNWQMPQLINLFQKLIELEFQVKKGEIEFKPGLILTLAKFS